MEFIWWGINVFLGCLFGLEAIHHRYWHDSLMHKRLHFVALIAFFTFCLISLFILLYESLPGTMSDFIDQITGSGLSLVLVLMSLPLLRKMKQSMSFSYSISGVLLVMIGVKFFAFPIFLLAPILCTFGVLLQYFGYTILLKKLERESMDILDKHIKCNENGKPIL